MGSAVALHHRRFGRAALLNIDRPFATHAHREGHLIFHVSGAHSNVDVCDRRHGVSHEQTVAVSPWQPHNFSPPEPGVSAMVLVLYIRPDWICGLGHTGLRALQFGNNQIASDRIVQGLVDRVVHFMLEPNNTDHLDGYLFELTVHCHDRSWSVPQPANNSTTIWQGVRDYRIRRSMKLMQAHLGDGIVLDRVARESGLSRPHFFKLFRENTGLTPTLFLNTLRIESSIERLCTSRDAITKIGLELGFASQASFTRFFAANVGIPPTDYRRAVSVS